MPCMEKASVFEARINTNFALNVPKAARERLGLRKGEIVRVTIERLEHD